MANIVEAKGLTKRYGKFTALDGVDIHIEEGRVVGLLGPNGSGKTTFIKILNELLVPTEGSVIIDGHRPGIQSKKVVSYLPDKDYLGDEMSFTEAADLFTDFYEDFDRAKAFQMIESLSVDVNKKFKFLSKGMREKAQLVLVMSRKAKLYILDEPIAGVDPASRDFILRTIMNNVNPGASVLIATHLISDIEKILDDVLFINNGKIVLDNTAENIREEKGKSIDGLFREVFSCLEN